VLYLDENQLTSLPPEICNLTEIKDLNGFWSNEGLKLQNNPLIFPPPEIISKGIEATFAFLRQQLNSKTSQ